MLERLVEILEMQGSIVHVDLRTLGWQDEFGWWHETEEGADALWSGCLRRWSADLSTEGFDARRKLREDIGSIHRDGELSARIFLHVAGHGEVAALALRRDDLLALEKEWLR